MLHGYSQRLYTIFKKFCRILSGPVALCTENDFNCFISHSLLSGFRLNDFLLTLA